MSTRQKIVLITGSSSGIGKSTAKKLIKERYIVYATARRTERLKELEDMGSKTMFLDVTDDKSMKKVVDTIISEQGKIDILINNAGYGSLGPIQNVSIEEAKHQFEVNVFGLAKLTQLVLPYMIKRRSGKIINISSVAGKVPSIMTGWYSASKFAVEALSDALRLEVKPFGIEVVIIEPEGIESEWHVIAIKHLLNACRNTGYKKIAENMAQTMNKRHTRGAEPPEVIAKTISNALKAKRPHSRYAVPRQAKIAIFLRWLLPDRLFDGFLRWYLKIPKKL
ncbi:short-chain dehydrogenase/reductase [Candidatus Atribacteria bacterium HGW-Atribacteria-1]|nr:MAG: short-chain dehydrogenase/reductase [Candidatus Atribacteria bacterium HGW-Atribacteria-1]